MSLKRYEDIKKILVNHKTGKITLVNIGRARFERGSAFLDIGKASMVSTEEEMSISLDEPQPCVIYPYPHGPVLACSREKVKKFETLAEIEEAGGLREAVRRSRRD